MKAKKQLELFDGAEKGREVAQPSKAPEGKQPLIAAGLTPEAERLLAKFEVVAEAPGGVKRLRELILELAVRGKLLPQALTDEPASQLLAKLHDEREKLIRAKKIRRGTELDPVSVAEQLFEIPLSWVWTRLGEIGDWGAGATPSRSNNRYYGGSTLWLKSGELNDNYVDTSEETVTDLALQECSLRLNEPGDVLIAMYGATIGKVAILRAAATTNQAVCACTVFSGVFNEYLVRALKALRRIFVGQGAGGAQPNISKIKIINTPFALPPLAEQKRIVAKVDELMKLCDDLEARQTQQRETAGRLNKAALDALTSAEGPEELAASWRRVAGSFDALLNRPESVEELRASVLELAVRGRLVPQDSADESASILLEKITREKHRVLEPRKKGPLRDDRSYLSSKEGAFALPPSWQWTRLGELCFKVADGPHFSPAYVSQDSGVPFLSARNIKGCGFDLQDLKYVSRDDHFAFCQRVKPEKGDILYTKGGTTGVAVVNELDFEFSVWVHVAVLKIAKSYLYPRYIALALNAPHCYAQSQRLTHGTGNRDLGLTRMISITLPLPPLAEQKRIVAKVDELMKLCDALADALRRAEDTAKNLADALVAELLA